jgi:hypothetical protein
MAGQTTMVTPGAGGVPAPGRTLLAPGENRPMSTIIAGSVERPASTTLHARRRWRLPVALGAAGLVAAGVVVALARLGIGGIAAAPEDAPAGARATSSAAVALALPPARPAPRATVSVLLGSTPAGARVTREEDGKLLGVTPFEEARPTQPGVQRLRVEREGYLAETVVLPLDRDFELSLPLQAQPASAARKKKPHERAAPTSAPSPAGAREPPAKPDINPEPVPL